MSFPLKRRIARAALLVAAAAPVIGMGATAASAAEQPQATGLGGLSKLDFTLPLDTVGKDSTPAMNATPVTNTTPVTNATPVVREATGNTSMAWGRVIDQRLDSLCDGNVVSSALPVHTSEVPHLSESAQHGLQTIHTLPLEKLLLEQLPLHELPVHGLIHIHGLLDGLPIG